MICFLLLRDCDGMVCISKLRHLTLLGPRPDLCLNGLYAATGLHTNIVLVELFIISAVIFIVVLLFIN